MEAMTPPPFWVAVIILTGVLVLAVLLLKVLSERFEKEEKKPKGPDYVPRPDGYKPTEQPKAPWEDEK